MGSKASTRIHSASWLVGQQAACSPSEPACSRTRRLSACLVACMWSVLAIMPCAGAVELEYLGQFHAPVPAEGEWFGSVAVDGHTFFVGVSFHSSEIDDPKNRPSIHESFYSNRPLQIVLYSRYRLTPPRYRLMPSALEGQATLLLQGIGELSLRSTYPTRAFRR